MDFGLVFGLRGLGGGGVDDGVVGYFDAVFVQAAVGVC